MPTCPHCEEEIDGHLAISQTIRGSEWGRRELPTDETDDEWEDSENNDADDYQVECPHCNEELSTEQIQEINRLYREANGLAPVAQRRRQRFFVNNLNTFRRQGTPADGEGDVINPGMQHRRFKTNATGQGMVECTHCQHAYEDELGPEMYCPKCNKAWVPENYKVTNEQQEEEDNWGEEEEEEANRQIGETLQTLPRPAFTPEEMQELAQLLATTNGHPHPNTL